jgi:hypothetical protein
MIVVYIASAYSLGDVGENVHNQLKIANYLIDWGFCPECPLLLHFQHIYKPHTYSEWMKIDLEKLSRSDVVLRLKGESSGADKEVEHAQSIGIPVVYSIDELLDLTFHWKPVD